MIRRLVTDDEARPAKRQHTKPCSDCPWARKSIRGWLGSGSVSSWLKAAMDDFPIHCHTLKGAQCAGSSIFRSHICKLPRYGAIKLESDQKRVFSTPKEFIEHHEVHGPKAVKKAIKETYAW